MGQRYIPIHNGDADVPTDASCERPDVGHNGGDDGRWRHDVERASAVGEVIADDTANGRAAIRDGKQVEGKVIRYALRGIQRSRRDRSGTALVVRQ